ncbi:MAG: class I tRNA ligase family protein [Patescibacteria group bacterium]|nr:class I tRNA ligase family protein [Patescibacteria group bacterium]MDE2438208.1 class I tRNA ligase family protein [Patescibacteria group bacterium]
MDPLNLAQLEERILAFWKERGIFEKTLKKTARKKPFVFFEGPPTANGRPGIHHFLGRAFKDIICRYQTMRGRYVTRKAGWDTHGLPVELGVEKALGIHNKKEIEEYGVAAFNAKARESVWQYKDEWEKFTERMGFWLDMSNPYVTYDNRYIENVWGVLKRIHKNYALEKDFRVSPYCVRCGTVLSSHELGQPGAYRLTRDPSLYFKLELKGGSKQKKEFLLVWTTTPWTLPANVAVAVHPALTYTRYDIQGEFLWAAKLPEKLAAKVQAQEGYAVTSVKGKALVGKKYVPLYPHKLKDAYRVVSADFVSAEEGTGLVHIAPAFGEDDMIVARKEKLPVLITLDNQGHMKPGEPGEGLFAKDADRVVFEHLRDRGLVIDDILGAIEHEYPFCWRCDTPLLYMARESWFIRMSKLRKEMMRNNETINWIPSHVREGRFGEWLKELKDWAISRERYWGTPLPMWQCEKKGHRVCIGSLEELNDRAYYRNTWYVMRHGQATHNVEGTLASGAFLDSSTLTEQGKASVRAAAKRLKKVKIDLIIASPAERVKETVALLHEYLKVPVHYDERLVEIRTGVFDGKSVAEHKAFFSGPIEEFSKPSPGGESLHDVAKRMMSAVLEFNRKYTGKRILLIGHGDPLWMLENTLLQHTPEETLASDYPECGDYKKIEVFNYPYNKDGQIDIHKPYIDEIAIKCPTCKAICNRTPEVMDVWFDSGAMPFAQTGRLVDCDPKKGLLQCIEQYPADYIVEGVDQTRGWFYTLLAVSTLLKMPPSYKNVSVLGLVLDEHGKKMSKSRGNITNPWDIMNTVGSDAARWYFYTLNQPYESKKFSHADLEKSKRKFFMTFWNVFQFYRTYVGGVQRSVRSTSQHTPSVLDRWIRAKTALLVKDVGAALDHFDVMNAARMIEQFVVEDYSRWWLRRSRRRFQRPESDEEFCGAANVFYEVMKTLVLCVAPLAPFFAEELYQEMKHYDSSLLESVHLENYPQMKQRGIMKEHEELFEQMELVRNVCAVALRLRAEKDIKVRQPLMALEIKTEIFLDKELLELVRDEVNVKSARRVKVLSHDAIANESDLAVALDTTITHELREEGLVRDFIRSLQELRADAGFQMGQMVDCFVAASDRLLPVFQRFEEQIKKDASLAHFEYARSATFDCEKTFDMEGEVTVQLKKC